MRAARYESKMTMQCPFTAASTKAPPAYMYAGQQSNTSSVHKEYTMKKDYISLKVDDDGDAQLRNVTQEEKDRLEAASFGGDGNLYFDSVLDVWDELSNYGFEDEEIAKALQALETSDEVTV